jgi:hypothetical protein
MLNIILIYILLSEKTKVHRLKDDYQGILQITYAEYNINLQHRVEISALDISNSKIFTSKMFKQDTIL